MLLVYSLIIGSKNGNGDTDSTGFFLDEVLRRGQIPLPVKCQVERTELVEKIRTELYKLSDSDGWVLIHGLPGFGKTTLAAESVRSAKLIQDVFPNGVFWISVKKMSNEHGEVDTSKLLEKLQNFIHRIDEDKYCPSNIEAATDYLQKVMYEQYPRSLLVLDDVWEKEVAQAFSVRCRALVTSRNADVASEVSTPSVYPVSVTKGLSDGEAREMLAKWSKLPVSSLPKEDSEAIIQYCRGSPLALGIVGALLINPNISHIRWKPILWQLKSKSQALSSVDASIRVSIEEFSQELKEFFDSLVVFAHSTVIPTRVLATFWSMNEFEAEEIMNSKLLCLLVCRSKLYIYVTVWDTCTM